MNLYKIANEARGLAMDAIAAAKSGHLGLPVGCAEVGVALFGCAMRYYPENARWVNRDRFVLSAGHGSMFLYAWLHMAGYKVSLDDIRAFRQMGSKTPGHPEFGHTEGVECTTGPLGQGIGNAVGLAVSQKKLRAYMGDLIDSHVFCLCGDGCMQEGVAMESLALAAHWKLDNLILLYDSNDVTLDASLSRTQSEQTADRMRAIGFGVQTVDGHNIEAVVEALERAKLAEGFPQIVIVKTVIGKGIPEVEGTAKAHGESGIKFAKEARQRWGLPSEPFYVSEETRAFFEKRLAELSNSYRTWQTRFDAWKTANAATHELLFGQKAALSLDDFPKFEKTVATRTACGEVLQSIAEKDPLFLTASADLFGSTKNYLKDGGDFSANNIAGRNLWVGIREHAMGAILNGIAYDDFFRPSGATFLVFSDYMRPAVRLAAMAKLPVIYLWTHDSVAVGEDGPTHQPVETVDSLRCIPNLVVLRPADAEETIGALETAYNRKDGPTAIILSRQDLPVLQGTSRKNVASGAYVVQAESEALQAIALASGSEVALAISRANKHTRVVSFPSMELFDAQPEDYRNATLDPRCKDRTAYEATTGHFWAKYQTTQLHAIHTFGLSAPTVEVLKHFFK
ncbi:MAG: hypothetical protein A2Y14_02430 [Verrucomicrobia bacterium GWF2_51_19]|nr:MAG: hypothetical protein A2Y14_02430 [Verrucomicrobia bacterium GWF2_51_19]